MAKIKVHELAKEIELQSKEVIACLEELGITGKTAASGLEEEQAQAVRNKLSKASAPKKVEEPVKAAEAPKPVKSEAPKSEAPKNEAPKNEAPKKKKKLKTSVYLWAVIVLLIAGIIAFVIILNLLLIYLPLAM